MRHAAPDAWLVLQLVLFVVALAAERMHELIISAGNVRRLVALGARESGRGHFPLIVAVHVAWPLAMIAEVVFAGARPGSLWPLWLGLVIVAQAIRYATIVTLGVRWTTGIWVIPGAPRIRTGPFRIVPHPNYVAVVLELLAAPMVFGAWRTAIVMSAVDLVALAIRIRAEERALHEAESAAVAGEPHRR